MPAPGTPPPPRGPLAGRVVGGFELVRLLAGGPQAATYLGRAARGDLVTVKVVPAGSPAAADLAAGAAAAAAADHPNVARAVAAGEDGGLRYAAVEYVDGVTLAELVRARGPVPAGAAARYAREAADGVGHLHTHGWVHGDLKPDNLVVGPGGEVKVIDLGMASPLAESGLPAGPPAGRRFRGSLEYAAPEVLMGAPADPRSDVYGLGGTLYFSLTGRPPHPPMPADVLVLWVMTADARPPPGLGRSIPAGLAQVVRRMIDPDPAHRYPGMAPAAAALARWLARYSPGDRPPID